MDKVKIIRRSTLIILLLVIAGLVSIQLLPDFNMYIVKSESMKPAINLGDIVVNGPLNGPFRGKVKPGTIITYGQSKGLVTHRVLSVNGNTLVTMGDAMEEPDPRPVTMSQVNGITSLYLPTFPPNWKTFS